MGYFLLPFAPFIFVVIILLVCVVVVVVLFSLFVVYPLALSLSNRCHLLSAEKRGEWKCVFAVGRELFICHLHLLLLALHSSRS